MENHNSTASKLVTVSWIYFQPFSQQKQDFHEYNHTPVGTFYFCSIQDLFPTKKI